MSSVNNNLSSDVQSTQESDTTDEFTQESDTNYEFADVFPFYPEEDEFESQWKKIPLQEYNALFQLQPQIYKLQKSIKSMEEKIKSKDSLLNILRKHVPSHGNCINVSNLSAVSAYKCIFSTHLRVICHNLYKKLTSETISFIVFQEQTEVIDCLANGIKSNKYPENVRKFAIRQQYYSTAAYKSLKLFFNNNLPGIRTLQMWYTSIDGSPGISRSALDILREKADSYRINNDNRHLHVCLISDEMSIRKELCYSIQKQSFVGFSTIINSSQQNNGDISKVKLAKDSLVFMIVGADFKLAVGYELLNGLETNDRAALTLQVIKRIEETGVRVISLTSDGLAANITTAESLGAKIDDGKPYFMSPTYPTQKIYCVLDPAHMLKLIRKHFSSNKIYHNDSLIDWGLLEKLVNKQSLDNFNFFNKLTQIHINWFQKPMNVKLAAETISKSVANALEQLRKDGYAEYEHSESTEQFLHFFNDAFDILNFGTDKKGDNRYKQKICKDTANHIFEFSEKFQQYVNQLEYRNPTRSTSIVKSTARRGFIGFDITFTSLRGIYEDFVKNGELDEFYPYQFSQDHLESYFSLIRYIQ